MGFVFMATTNLALGQRPPRRCRHGGRHRPAGRRIRSVSRNTIAATATASFLLNNPPQGADPEAIGAAQAAPAWTTLAAVIFGIATVVSLALINAGKHQVADIEPMPGM